MKGKVEDTLLLDNLPKTIAILRLDTDFYESTKAELEVLLPKVVVGGILIVDDYGAWAGLEGASMISKMMEVLKDSQFSEIISMVR